MTEQIMKILPAKKESSYNMPDDWITGYNRALKDCAAAIEKANLVRCPTEEEILNCISAVCQCSSCVTCRESAKALIALLHSAQKTHSSGKKYDDTDHEID